MRSLCECSAAHDRTAAGETEVQDFAKEYTAFAGSYHAAAKLNDAAELACSRLCDQRDRARQAQEASGAEAGAEQAKAVYELTQHAELACEARTAGVAILAAEANRLHTDRLTDTAEALRALATREIDHCRAMLELWNQALEAINKIHVQK
eukprot:TRINITY_DN2498_c0_g1_i2.p2 TRINITY_DN2498_c0_g1~~TRINITY_DN2498_c0_g1_i2.p2  ORF type:complete len:151 (+),score=43.56 TRINITY_DN2498_c0_g1_i2:1632-2084(+)